MDISEEESYQSPTFQRFRGNDFSLLADSTNDNYHTNNNMPQNQGYSIMETTDLVIKDEDPLELLYGPSANIR